MGVLRFLARLGIGLAAVSAVHAVGVGGVLWGVGRLETSDWRLGIGDWRLGIGDWRLTSTRVLISVFLLVGLGLANHLTTVVLLPGVLLAVLFAILHSYRSHTNTEGEPSASPQSPVSSPPIPNLQSLISNLILALLLPLALYLYLPIRWAAVNDEPMGWGRFVDWVIGGRFQGALQLDAFLNDPSRYGVVGRLLLAEWQPWWLLLPAALGFAWLVWRRWRLALILGLTLVGFIFYGLSYYVPDLAVFLLPAQLVMVVVWGVGWARLESGDWGLEIGGWRLGIGVILAVGVMGVLVNGVAGRWEVVDRSEADGGVPWARAVLERPLEEGAAILADSARFPPLYYLQQAEGVRPDLDIMVLPDEAAYRAELSARLAAGQTVYLARFLPGLEGQYHLRSEGPLVEVGREPLEALPPDATGSVLDFGNVELEGYELADPAAADAGAVALTLYWRAEEAPEEALYVYTRWQGPDYDGAPLPAGGQHPANNSYPTAAWVAGEVVPDYHLLPRPLLGQMQELALQVALAPSFSASGELDWQTVTTITVAPPDELPDAAPVYAQLGAALVDGVQVENQVRPQPGLPAFVSGCGDAGALQLELRRAGEAPSGQGAGASEAACGDPFVLRQTVDAEREAGDYALWALAGGGARCHWLAGVTGGCRLATVEISGAALPAGATNFGDRIALTSLEVTESDLRPGGEVTVDVAWLALAGMEENYTVFAQVVDAQDRIVGQVDTWPVQGTYGTSAWAPGEVVRDSYTVRLEGEVAEGEYRLLLGWYLLATQQRLPVLDEGGAIVDDRVVAPLNS